MNEGKSNTYTHCVNKMTVLKVYSIFQYRRLFFLPKSKIAAGHGLVDLGRPTEELWPYLFVLFPLGSFPLGSLISTAAFFYASCSLSLGLDGNEYCTSSRLPVPPRVQRTATG